MEEQVQTIKRALVRLERSALASKEEGDKFDHQLGSIMSSNKMVTVVHIVLTVIFGGIWVYLVKQLKQKH